MGLENHGKSARKRRFIQGENAKPGRHCRVIRGELVEQGHVYLRFKSSTVRFGWHILRRYLVMLSMLELESMPFRATHTHTHGR